MKCLEIEQEIEYKSDLMLSKSKEKRKSLLFLLAIIENIILPMVLTIIVYIKIDFISGISIITWIYIAILSIIIVGYYLYIRNKLREFAFILPAYIALVLFVFIPIGFALIVSLYENPTALELRNAFKYYMDTSNISLVSIFDFFFLDDPVSFDKGVFLIGGITFLLTTILMIFYIRIAYRRLSFIQRFKSKIVRVSIAFILGLIVAPLTLLIFEWIIKGIAIFGTLGLPFEEYRDVLTAPSIDFMRILFNTFFWTLSCTVLHVILGMALAILLNRKFAGRGVFRSIFILPWAIPSFVSTLMWRAYVFDKDSGVLGSLTGQFGSSASFSVGNLIGLILAALAGILIAVYSYKLLSKSRKSLLFLLAIIESIILPMILTILVYKKIGFTYGIDIITLIYLVILSIVIVGHYLYIKNKLRESEVKISPGFRPLTFLMIGIISIILIILYNDLFQIIFGQFQEGFMGYKIFNIPEIQSTFWYTDDVYIFGVKFKMITFSAILINVWLGVPFMMLSFLATLQSIPQELYEAAEIDGLSNWGQFRKVTLPLLKPTLLTVSLLGIIWTFNLFNVVYLLSQNQTGIGDAIWYDIFVTFIYNRFYDNADYSAAAALSFTVFIILISFSLVYRKLIKTEEMWESE